MHPPMRVFPSPVTYAGELPQFIETKKCEQGLMKFCDEILFSLSDKNLLSRYKIKIKMSSRLYIAMEVPDK